MDIASDHNNKGLWDYYTRQGKDSARCNKCKKVIKAVGGSTSGLHSHLRTQHKLNLLKRANLSTSVNKEALVEAGPSRGFLQNYIKSSIDKSLAAIISRMVAKDGISFVKFTTSFDLRRLLTEKGFSVPNSSNTIRSIVIDYGNKIRQEIRDDISIAIKKDEFFSLTMDEWTSTRNKRYMNINAHVEKNHHNLGLARAKGYMPAETCLEVLEDKLKQFGILLHNVISITTDGASVMKKMVSNVDIHHQLCIAHGIQLAIIKVLYGRTIAYDTITDDFNRSTNEGESDEEYENEDESFSIANETTDQHAITIADIDIHKIIDKVRQVTKTFRRSPTKNDAILQKHVKSEFGKEKALILDNKTRWNSLLSMLERFFELKTCIRKSLIDLKIDISFSEVEMNLINSTISALQPVKLAVESLGSSDSTLLSADVAIKFMLDELSSQNRVLSTGLKLTSICLIKERRTIYSDILQYLHNPSEYRKLCAKDIYGIFNMLNKSTITKIIVALVERLHLRNRTEWVGNENESSDEDEVVELASAVSMKEKLQLAIKQKTNQKLANMTTAYNTPITNTKTLTSIVKREMTNFEQEMRRGKYLELTYHHLLTIKPTSVESERVFSAAGQICTKIRSNLSDESIDTICLLRAYFIKQDEMSKI